jgi:hypothetical protein
MKKEVMKKWVAALRYGKYQQIDGRLRSIEPDKSGAYSYCCLGVLCDLHRKEHNPDGGDYHYTWGEGMSQAGRVTTAYANHADTLPHSVREWAGIASCNPELLADPDGNGKCTTELVALNDDFSFEFPELADLIEDQYEDL